jgi:hypothetical protein
MAMNEIPGSDAVGYGFNALGPYDPNSLMSQVFIKSYTKNNTYTYQPTNIEYRVPDNVNVVSFSPVSGKTTVFQKQIEVQSYLSTKAEISGSYGAFSGQIEAAYGSAVDEWGSVFYGITDAWVGTWMVVLAQVNESALDPAFRQVLIGLPPTFDDTTIDTYFSFFQQYGTHFVHSAGVGGYFFYFQGIENTGSVSFQQAQAKANLEYNAVYVDAGAKAEADWGQLGQQWVTERNVSISALGGSAKTLEDVTPVFNTNEAQSFTNWQNSVEGNPSSVRFILRGWDELLATGSPQQSAMKQALDDYMSHTIYVNSVYSGASQSNVIVGGEVVVPAQSWPLNPQSKAQGIEIVLVDNIGDLSVTFSSVYFINADGSNFQQFFGQIMQDLQTFADAEEQWCCFSLFNFPWGVLPDSRLLAWLQQFGITGQKCTTNYYACANGQASFSYVALGLVGRHDVHELVCLNPPGTETILEINVYPLSRNQQLRSKAG